MNYNNLTTLKGCPKEIISNPGQFFEANFRCNNNNLTSLEFCPKRVDGEFHCGNNKKRFSGRTVLSYCKVRKSEIYL